MAEKKYLNLEGLQDVANHVNTRLKTVTTIPASADDGAVRLYVGETGATYTKGHIYQYNATDLEWVDITSSSEYTAGNGIDITNNEISVETYIFTGTQAQWDALTTEQKKEYDICNITDDASSDDEIYTKSEIDAMLGTAASKDATDVVRPNDHDLVESNAVYAAINNALSSIYTPRGDLTCAELTSALLVEQNVGNVYQMTDSGTTSALFINGAGHTINVNDNVGIIKAGQDTYLFNLMGNAFDLHDYQKKDLETAIEGQTTVVGALGALSINKADADNVYTKTEADALLDDKVSYEDNGILGAKNFVPYPYPVSSATVNGITFTTYRDGRVVANGTATELAIFDVINSELYKPFSLDEGNYILTDGLSSSDYENAYTAITLVFSDGTIEYNRADTSIGKNGFSMPSKSNIKYFYLGCCVKSGATVSNLTFRPMIRLASDPDSTYQPFAMTNQQITPYVQAISNPNLLDNPWFTINQRGVTNWSSDYGVDRWMPQRADITINADKTLTVTPTELSTNNGYIGQRIEKVNSLLGKTVTLSILLSNGTIVSHTFNTIEDAINNGVEGNYNFGYSTTTSNSYDLVWFGLRSKSTISSVTIKALKLELGSVSTLAMDTAPNTATELMKCQRYFVRLKSGFNESSITGFAVANNIARFGIPLPTMMRTSPSVTVSNLSHWGASATNAQGALVATAISKQGGLGNIITLEITNSNITQSTTYILYSLSADSYIDFSADL